MFHRGYKQNNSWCYTNLRPIPSNQEYDGHDDTGNRENNPSDQEESSDYEPYSSDNSDINVVEEMQNIESRLNSRISDIEARQNNQPQQNYSNSSAPVTNKYVCSMEGTLDRDNNVIPLNSQQPSANLQNQKIVFVCEYRN